MTTKMFALRELSRVILEEGYRKHRSALSMADKLIAATDNEPYCRTRDHPATRTCQTAQEPWVSKLHG